MQNHKKALVIVNYQNDYFPGGSLPIPGVESIMPVIKTLRTKKFDYFILTRLWHPIDHK